MWHKILKNDTVIRNASKGDYLRFIGDSGDLIADIEEIHQILNIFNDKIEYVNLRNEKTRIDPVQRFESGNWYISKTM